MTIVTNAAELLVALSAAGGEVIELAPGNYGDVTLDGMRFAGTVMIRSQDALAPATFDSLQVKNASYITFENISVRHVLDAGEPNWVSGFRIDVGSHCGARL